MATSRSIGGVAALATYPKLSTAPPCGSRSSKPPLPNIERLRAPAEKFDCQRLPHPCNRGCRKLPCAARGVFLESAAQILTRIPRR
jgi:hypothetical protein